MGYCSSMYRTALANQREDHVDMYMIRLLVVAQAILCFVYEHGSVQGITAVLDNCNSSIPIYLLLL